MQDSGDPNASDTASAEPEVDPEEVPAAEQLDPSDAVFDPSVIHMLRLEMSTESWADIQDNPWAENWHEATFRWCPDGAMDCEDEEVQGPIGVRTFGNGSLTTTKPSLKLSFDHTTAGNSWRGLEQLKLDNSSQDVGFIRERIATAILRRWGLPAARTGWARVLVNDESAGFFVVLESIDDRFLERWFGDDQGNLYGTAGTTWGHGLEPMEDPFVYYDVQTNNPTDGSDLLAAVEALASGTDKELRETVDLDQFTAISVARSVMGSTDSFSADGNNYYLYVEDGLVHQIPWDFDNDFGGFSALDSRLTVSLEAPWTSSVWAYDSITGAPYADRVHERAIEQGADLDALVAELVEGPMDFEVVDAEIADAAALIREEVWADPFGYGSQFDQRIAETRMFVHTRLSTLAGREVADCAELSEGVLPLSALGPTGTVGSGSLTVDSTSWGPGFTINGEQYCTGIYAHGPSDVTITVPEGHGTLSGKVGVQDWYYACGDGMVFTVEQAGVVLWESGTLGTFQAAEPFDGVELSPGDVSLKVAINADYYCDQAAWVDVVLAPSD